jgi:hypothetical protein
MTSATQRSTGSNPLDPAIGALEMLAREHRENENRKYPGLWKLSALHRKVYKNFIDAGDFGKARKLLVQQNARPDNQLFGPGITFSGPNDCWVVLGTLLTLLGLARIGIALL